MTYKLEFLPSARKEWDKLGHTLRDQLKKKLAERLENPRVPADALHGMPDCYKIKLKSSGYRLVYEVIEARVVVSVAAVGKRERSAVDERVKKPR
jgi:mRNA interferase RelE/StbE